MYADDLERDKLREHLSPSSGVNKKMAESHNDHFPAGLKAFKAFLFKSLALHQGQSRPPQYSQKPFVPGGVGLIHTFWPK